MTAYSELQYLLNQGDSIAYLCKLGCDIMLKISELTGFSYNEVNIFILYVIQPLLLILSLLLIYIKLFKIGNIFNKIFYGLVILTQSIAGYNFLRGILNQNWNQLGNEVINKIQQKAHDVDWNYAEYNIYIFVIGFVILFMLNVIYLILCNKNTFFKLIGYIYWLIPGSMYISMWIY